MARLVDEGVAQVVVDLRAARQRRPQDDDAVVRQVACSRPTWSGTVPHLGVSSIAAYMMHASSAWSECIFKAGLQLHQLGSMELHVV